MGHSTKCSDLKTYYNTTRRKCVLCPVKAGYEVSPNCGHDDKGGQHELMHKECTANSTFNDGSSAYCTACSSCPPGYNVSSPCTTTTNTTCQFGGSATTAAPVPKTTTSQHVSTLTSQVTEIGLVPLNDIGHNVGLIWAVPLVVTISAMLLLTCAFLIYTKRRRGQHTALSYCRRSSFINAGFSPLSAPPGNNQLEHILSPDILSAPLQTVLDNLDVLEELIILLDPESHGVKNTKHLASHCSFTAAWITYTYSMKDSKSPLKAVLEGVTSRNPDWTVGHLAKLLKQMERNDAIAVLAKLRLDGMQV